MKNSNVQVTLLKPYGFCAGVERAINLAKKVKQDNPDKTVKVLGMLVHNADALKELTDLGIKIIYKDNAQYIDLIDEVDKEDLVILTAHGHSDEVEEKLKEKGVKYFDATCPYVTLTHNLIKDAIRNGNEVIYIGKKNHPEAVSSLSISSKVHLYEIKEGLDLSKVKDDTPLLVSQTTFSKEEISDIEAKIKKEIPGAKIVESVCNASSLRQNAIKEAKDVDLIYVVGGLNSNNTKTLEEISKKSHPTAKVIRIQNKNDINKKNLIGLSRIAISSGASTPKYISEEIVEYIKQLLD